MADVVGVECAGQRGCPYRVLRGIGWRLGRTRLSHWNRLAASGVDWASAPAARAEATTMDASMVCSVAAVSSEVQGFA